MAERLEERVVLTTPVVVSIGPDANSHSAPVATGVNALYDQAINPSTVSDLTFSIHGMQSGKFRQPPNIFDVSGEAVSLSPGFGIRFAPGELVQATLTSQVQNTLGEPGAKFVWQFRTAPSSGSGFFDNSGQSLGSFTTSGAGLGDLDGDTDLDAFVSDSAGVRVYLNNGTGTLTAGQAIPGTTSQRVLLGDVDGDGDLDAIAGRLFLNNGTAMFTASQDLSGTSLGDVDGDGDLDLLGTNIFVNNAGFFSPAQALGNGALGDLDGDGDLDAFVIRGGAEPNEVWVNDGSGNFTRSGQSLGSSDGQTVVLGDLDGDGDLDAFVGNGSGQPDRIWINDGNGLFLDSGQLIGDVATRAVALGDLDADGDLDVMVTSVTTRVWLNDGLGHLAMSTQTLNGANGRAVALGDLNGDGALDTFIGNEGGSADQIFFNLGVPPITHDRYENNNSSGTAVNLDVTPFHLADQLYQVHEGLSIHSDIDRDWFQYTVPETGPVTIEIQFQHALGDLDLSIFDKNLTQLAFENSQTDNERKTLNASAGDKFFIQVSGFGGATNPDYDLVVLGAQYRPDMFEGAQGNRNRSRAVNLGSSSQTHANLTIHNKEATDWFKITAPQTGTLEVELFFNHSQGDLDLVATDVSGSIIASSETDTNDERVAFPGISGLTYFIHVYGYQKATNPNYALSINTGNKEPTISDVPHQTLDEDFSTGPISFVINDDMTAPGSLLVSAVSSNPDLVPSSSIFFGGSGSNRTIMVTPVPNQSGNTTMTITVNDGTGGVTTETFQVTVRPKADLPNLTVSNAAGNEDAPIPLNIAAGLTDTDGSETLTIVISGMPIGARLSAGTDNGNGTWNLTSAELSALTVTPPPDDSNDFTLTVTARATEVANGESATRVGAINVTVLPFDDPPTVSSIANQTIQEDATTGTIPFTIGDDETSANSLTVTATSDNQTLIPNSNLILGGTGSARTITVEPVLNQSGGPVRITVAVNDGIHTTTRFFNVTVLERNDLPTISPISDQMIAEDSPTGPLTFIVGDVETSPNLLTITATSSNQAVVPNGNIQLGGSGASRTLNIIPAANQSGTTTITLSVSDGTDSASRSFAVTVTPENDPPSISAIADQTIEEDGATGDLPFTIHDLESAVGTLTVSATSSNQTLIPNSNIAVGGTGGSRTIRVTPAPNQNGGPVSVTISVSDGVNTAQKSFAVTVTPVNDPPVLVNPIGSINTNEDAPNMTFNLSTIFQDADIATSGDALTFLARFNSNPDLVTASISSGVLTLDFMPNQSGSAIIIVRATDNGIPKMFDEEEISITVSAGNDLPSISEIPTQNVDEDTSSGAISFTIGDAESPTGSLVVTAASSNQSLIPDGNLVLAGSGADRTITITPAANQHGGPVTITVTVSDGTDSASETFEVTVRSVNDLPTISTVSDQTTMEDLPTALANFTVSDLETAAGSLIIGATSSAPGIIPNGNIAIGGSGGNRTVTVTPAINQNGGPVTITLSVSDGTDVVTTEFDVTVVAVNDAPTISDISNQVVPQDTSTDPIAFAVGDAETATTSLIVTSSSDNQLLVPDDNIVLGGSGTARTVAITPAANQTGIVTITIAVEDNDGAMSSESFTLNVTRPNETLPTVSIVDVSPNPRAGAVNQIMIVFNEPVVGFDLADVSLTRSASSTVSLLPGTATLTSTDGMTWLLGNLRNLTSGTGIYHLTLGAEGSDIRDLQGASLAVGDSEQWINGPGDSDENGRFDQFDLIFGLQGSKYLTGQPATWRQGDWNGDGVFNQADIILALQPHHYLKGSFAAQSPQIGLSTAAADPIASSALAPQPAASPDEATDTRDALFEQVGDSQDVIPVIIEGATVVHHSADGSIFDAALVKDAVDIGDDVEGLND